MLKIKRPDMEGIESDFKSFERPSATDSRKMADYIYALETSVHYLKHLQWIWNKYQADPFLLAGNIGAFMPEVEGCSERMGVE